MVSVRRRVSASVIVSESTRGRGKSGSIRLEGG